ncbi:hypothetical protein HYPSUDRAFT_210179 [Hypholoma sublateritium FD-334 SS-4]|uniref:Uncharacterized protein n=1 Tax=Hypholoma sublateritium (strain FD-334 SS-4) TaxID=945553 RepID=A0A0D2N7K1_HYPSF|nr:hypothetical protein HYPSUDRAFT_210179 [Hypholoma sublateritium FD-334 SS-4]
MTYGIRGPSHLQLNDCARRRARRVSRLLRAQRASRPCWARLHVDYQGRVQHQQRNLPNRASGRSTSDSCSSSQSALPPFRLLAPCSHATHSPGPAHKEDELVDRPALGLRSWIARCRVCAPGSCWAASALIDRAARDLRSWMAPHQLVLDVKVAHAHAQPSAPCLPHLLLDTPTPQNERPAATTADDGQQTTIARPPHACSESRRRHLRFRCCVDARARITPWRPVDSASLARSADVYKTRLQAPCVAWWRCAQTAPLSVCSASATAAPTLAHLSHMGDPSTALRWRAAPACGGRVCGSRVWGSRVRPDGAAPMGSITRVPDDVGDRQQKRVGRSAAIDAPQPEHTRARASRAPWAHVVRQRAPLRPPSTSTSHRRAPPPAVFVSSALRIPSPAPRRRHSKVPASSLHRRAAASIPDSRQQARRRESGDDVFVVLSLAPPRSNTPRALVETLESRAAQNAADHRRQTRPLEAPRGETACGPRQRLASALHATSTPALAFADTQTPPPSTSARAASITPDDGSRRAGARRKAARVP